MKNIFKGLLIGAAVVAMTSCVEESLVQFDPENAVAPVLNDLPSASYELTDGGDFATFTWFEADFGVAAAVRYTLYASCEGYTDRTVGYVDGIGSTSLTVDAATINNVLISSFECEAYSPYEISFYLVAAIKSTSGLTDASLTSNTISATLTPFPAEITYDCVYVTGTLNNWSFTGPYLYNYENDGVNYQGVIDFTEDYASNEFKITDVDGWGGGNFGASDTTEGGDPDSYSFVDGSNDNVKVYRANRYYHFTFDKSALTIYKDYGFDAATVTVNGADYEMTYSLGKQRFYVDVEGASGTVIASLDGTQFTSADLTASGDQRIYFDFNDLNNVSLFGSASMYGQDEDVDTGGDEGDDEGSDGWQISGSFNGWTPTDMDKVSNIIYKAAGVSASDGDEFVFAGPNSTWWGADALLKDSDNHYVATIGESFAIAEDSYINGKVNVAIPDAGTYDIYVYTNEETCIIMNDGEVPGIVPDTWGVVGDITGWGAVGDLVMTTETVDGTEYLVYYGLPLTSTDGIKIRYNNEWNDDANYGSYDNGTYSPNTAISVFSGGSSGNIYVSKSGTYDIYFDKTNGYVWIMTAGYLPGEVPASWGIVGTNNNWGGEGDDFAMDETSDGLWVAYNFEVSGGNFEMKFRYDNDSNWAYDNDLGAASGVSFAVGSSMLLAHQGSNIYPEDGTYDIYLDPESLKAWFMNPGEEPILESWCVAGGFNNWATDDEMTYDYNTGLWVYTGADVDADNTSEGFKIQKNNWASEYGGPMYGFVLTLNGAIGAWSSGGSNILFPEAGVYDIYFDEAHAAIYVVNSGETPTLTFWGISGTLNSWGNTTITYNGTYWFYPGLAMEEGDEVKFLKDASWDVNFGGDFAVDTAIDVTQGGSNIKCTTAGTYDLYLDVDNAKAYIMTSGKTPADAN